MFGLCISQYLLGAGWKSLTGKQKQVVCLSLYFAANWIHELVSYWNLRMLPSCFRWAYIRIISYIWSIIFCSKCSSMLFVQKLLAGLNLQVRLQKRKWLQSYWSDWGILCTFLHPFDNSVETVFVNWRFHNICVKLLCLHSLADSVGTL